MSPRNLGIPTNMSPLRTPILSVFIGLVGCAGPTVDNDPAARSAPEAPPAAPVAQAPAPPPTPPPPPKPPDPLRHRDDLVPQQQAVIVIDGQERTVDRQAALDAGYTLVDMTDTWTPFIFEEFTDAKGKPAHNRHRSVFLGLANDKTDGEGQPLDEGERNFLELYGIPPAISVLRARALEAQGKTCYDEIDFDVVGTIERVAFRQPAPQRRHDRKIKAFRRQIDKALAKAKLEDADALVEQRPKLAPKLKAVRRRDTERLVFAAAEQRLRCDGHLTEKSRHKAGLHDYAMKLAVQRFQRQHMIYEHPYLRNDTLIHMGRKPAQLDHQAFVRAFRERLISAADILEDGTAVVGDHVPTYVSARTGETLPVPNLVESFTQTAIEQLGLTTSEALVAFYARHPADHFEWLHVGVKLPPRPEYYSAHMDLSIVVDRGDVWYDPPWDANDTWRPQRRARMPKLWLYLEYNGQRFPLVRWPTTIGGWRAEQAPNGYEYYKYKGSDVGPRVIRRILSGPVWVAPQSTPIRGMTKRKRVNGTGRRIVNYEEMGPGYQSAYGLVAGYFVIPGKNGRSDADRGIRAHGSSDYMSIRSYRRYSHGCHRLLNHLAVRLYSFVLHHRTHTVVGDRAMRHKRQFLREGQVFEVRMPSRGFEFFLEPALPVNVLEGRIRGKLKKPVEGFVPRPGVRYPEPESAPAAETEQPPDDDAQAEAG